MIKQLLLGIIFLIFLPNYCVASLTQSNPIPLIPGEGLEAEGNKDWHKAISIYLEALSKNPNRVDLWIRIATIEHELKDEALSINAYQHAVKLQPNNPALHKTLSEIYAESNHPGLALVAIDDAVKLRPNDINYLFARAKIANWNKKLDIALSSDERLLELSKNQKI